MSHGKAQSLSLAYGVVYYSFMLSENISLFIHEVSGLRRLTGELLHYLGIIAVRHEADVLAVRLMSVHKTVLFCHLPCFSLGELSQREQGMSQQFLSEIIENVALIFRIIEGTLKDIPVYVFFYPGIMSGHYVIAAQDFRPLIQSSELQIFIAVNAWIGSRSHLIRFCELIHYE